MPTARSTLLALGLFAVSAASLAASCGGDEFSGTASSSSTGAGAGGSGGGGSECVSASDCPGEDGACFERTCAGGVCGTREASAGEPAPDQIEGDCNVRVCDGKGGTEFADDPRDVPLEDGNPCTKEICEGGLPKHPPKPVGSQCAADHVCNDEGACVDCLTDDHCAGTDVCQNQSCVPVECIDGVKNGDETDVDCGGSCAPCNDGKGCAEDDDCKSHVCGPGNLCIPCFDDGDCPSGEYCSSGACLPKKPEGQPCGAGAQCESGDCVDGVCCDGPCTGPCVACSGSKKGEGIDGNCGVIEPGADPDNECQSSPACGTGACNGAGACDVAPVGTDCSTCNGGATAEQSCDGSGTCVPSGLIQLCAPFACGPTTCLSDCTTNAECAPGYYCDTQKMPPCAAKQMDGMPCGDPGECVSNGCCQVCDHCCNGIADVNEADVDCGGPDCAPCP